MKVWSKVVTGGLVVMGALVVGHGNANAEGDTEYASMVLGWEGDKVEWGMCVDKPTQAQAVACAKARFEANGGHAVGKQWVWTCHGWWAVAVSKTGRTAG